MDTELPAGLTAKLADAPAAELPVDLDAWLEYIASVHPREIELGLERSRRVAEAMTIKRPAALVVTVAGTNGKGSTVAAMQSILLQAGINVGSYTSPHIHSFNERILLNGIPCEDAVICAAFLKVEESRGNDSLSYFEFATLAALWIFQQSEVDVALLEVGLGGRLDAVNIVDADVTIISSIGIDHQDWLGPDREAIGFEKAGIMRSKIPAVIGERSPPESLSNRAVDIGAKLFQIGREFEISQRDGGAEWWGTNRKNNPQQLNNLPIKGLAASNIACAVQALYLLPIDLQPEHFNQGLQQLEVTARFECRRDRDTGTRVIFDVAHNSDATALLAKNLQLYRRKNPQIERVTAVLAVMADKDIEGMASALESCLDFWYIAQVDEPRCMLAETAKKRIESACPGLNLRQFDDLETAYRTACDGSAKTEQDLILVFGSFYTVSAVHKLSERL